LKCNYFNSNIFKIIPYSKKLYDMNSIFELSETYYYRKILIKNFNFILT